MRPRRATLVWLAVISGGLVVAGGCRGPGGAIACDADQPSQCTAHGVGSAARGVGCAAHGVGCAAPGVGFEATGVKCTAIGLDGNRRCGDPRFVGACVRPFPAQRPYTAAGKFCLLPVPTQSVFAPRPPAGAWVADLVDATTNSSSAPPLPTMIGD